MKDTKSEPIDCDKLCDPESNNPIEVTSDNITEVSECDKLQTYIGKGSIELQHFKEDHNKAYRPHVMKGYCGSKKQGGTRCKKRMITKKRKNTKKRRNINTKK